MKRFVTVVSTVLIAAMLVVGCGSTTATNTAAGSAGAANDDKIQVVATVFPAYDWAKEVTKGNDNVEVSMLIDSGVDLHSFQPSADDIIKISTCDVFIYVGGESDTWVEDVLTEASNKDMVVINMLDAIGDNAREEELVEGMQGEEEEEEEEEGEEEGPEYDEHVWLSVKNAKILTQEISDKMCEADPASKDLYTKNAADYVNALDELDAKYEAAVAAGSQKTLLFGDRFPFRYMVEDYGLDYYAAFIGCSAESEASFETIAFLASKTDELRLKVILQIESSDGKIAKTVKDSTQSKDQEILTMDSMQSVTSDDVANGETYLSVMEKNLEVLQRALQ